MIAPVVCVAGTWAETSEATKWWLPGSVWSANLRNAGLELLDEKAPFEWSTDMAYEAGAPSWRIGGQALKWYVAGHGSPRVSLVAHSHGGQVVAWALSLGLEIAHLITCATPVRSDMAAVWAEGLSRIHGTWTHLYTDETGEPWQMLGSLPLHNGEPFRRDMPFATKNIEIIPPTTHRGCMWPALWNAQGYWKELA